MTKTLKIEGMSCEHCARAVTMALEGVTGVLSAAVALESKEAIVQSSGETADEALRAAVEDAGYEVTEILAE